MTSAEMMAGVQHQEAGELAQAEAIFRKVLADSDDANACYRLAVICQLQGRPAEAALLYERLLQTKPDAAKVHNNLGLAYVTLERLDDAMACYLEAIRLQPNFAEAYNNLGTLHVARGDTDRGIDAFRQALTFHPTFPAALSNLGRAYLTKQQWQDAATHFSQALAFEPKNAAVLNSLGNALLNQGRLDEAADSYRRALAVRPRDAEAYYNLGRVFSSQRQWHAAVECLQHSLECDAGSALAHRLLGDIFYCQLARYSDALRCYQHVLALSPDDARVRLLVGALSGTSELSQVPASYIVASYEPWAERFEQEVRQRGDFSPQALKAALGAAPPPRSLAVLDLGCGTGLCGVEFRDWAKTLIGVDLTANMLARARQRHLYDELIHGDLLTPLQGCDSSFDLIVASDVVLYLGDLRPLMHAVGRALRPGGRFAFTIDLLVEGTGYRLTPWVHFAHARSYLQELAQETQLQEIYVREVFFPRTGSQHAKGLVLVWARS